MSLPKFVKGSNVHTFLKLFNNSMFGATDREKATTVINCLDTVCVELVMPHLPAKRWSYYEACATIIAKFGSEANVATKKDTFIRVKKGQ